jgi:hypothetical protein
MSQLFSSTIREDNVTDYKRMREVFELIKNQSVLEIFWYPKF